MGAGKLARHRIKLAKPTFDLFEQAAAHNTQLFCSSGAQTVVNGHSDIWYAKTIRTGGNNHYPTSEDA